MFETGVWRYTGDTVVMVDVGVCMARKSVRKIDRRGGVISKRMDCVGGSGWVIND